MKTAKQISESKQIREETNRVVNEIREKNGLKPLKKDLKPLINFEADDTISAAEASDQKNDLRF